MKKINKKRMTFTIVALVLIIVLGIGYAALTTALKINSHVSLGEISFAIHFDNVQPLTSKATVNTEAYIVDQETKKEISFDVSLAKLNDFYKFTTDIVNDGTIPGRIKSIELTGLSESQKRLLKFRVSYTTSNKTMAVGDFLGPESSKNITVELLYELSEDVTDEDLLAGAQEIDCSFIITFENGNMNEYLSRAASNRLMQDIEFFPTTFLNLTVPASANEHGGVYRVDGTENDDYPIYFYRGSNDNVYNHVLFGGYCWRILRTTNTGGIKIIYNGTPTEDGKCMTLTGDATIVATKDMGTTTEYYWNAYAYSPLKTWMSTWYFEHLINYQDYLEDTPFCNDNSYYVGNISTDCDPDWTISVANGKNNYPIGLISAQEANMAGVASSDSSYPWIYSGNSIMTMSRNGAVNHGWGVHSGLHMVLGTGNAAGIRPVVSLNSEVVLSGGAGTTTNPYTVSLG